ncbi:MAG: YkgJ family cysteine cluster protein [Lachnospiraceae bacterium]|nr:YkgJ family cysteine cluster protein [Lachnospiraceae bacterium]
MLRQEKLSEISDGRRYGLNDMVKADAGGCNGCSYCCETMTDTIALSPLDVFRMGRAVGKSFGELLDGYIELNMRDGVILPNIRSGGEGCVFLSEEKRCTIHGSRPDFCRLFPLGRLYEEDSFSYILQTGQCRKNCTKVKVKKWIDTPDYEKNRAFILSWHSLVRRIGEIVLGVRQEGEGEGKNAGKMDSERVCGKEKQKLLMTLLLEIFYARPYITDDFYEEFEKRKKEYLEKIGI